MTAAGHIAVGMLIDQHCPPELAFGAGVLGQLAPDIVDGIYSLLNPQAWQTGKLLCPWHRAGAELFKRDMGWASTFAVEALLIWWALR